MKARTCTGSILYGGRTKSDFDTIDINFVGSHLYCTMDSSHKTHTLVSSPVLVPDIFSHIKPAINHKTYYVSIFYCISQPW